MDIENEKLEILQEKSTKNLKSFNFFVDYLQVLWYAETNQESKCEAYPHTDAFQGANQWLWQPFHEAGRRNYVQKTLQDIKELGE